MSDAASILKSLTDKARQASRSLARADEVTRNLALTAAAAALRENSEAIVAANQQDLATLSADRTAAFQDRLTLTAERVEAMAKGLEDVARLPDPLGRILAEWERPNGLLFRRVAVPLGVIGMIYESRPNVGADAAALCIKSGNAVILRGGGESLNSARAIHAAMVSGLEQAGLDPACVQILPSADRALVGALLQAADGVDLIIPRGGKSLVERVQREARVPVLAHADGLNHTYVHASADSEMARRVLLDAKMRRTGICGATETLLIDRAIAPSLLPLIVDDLAAKGCTFRADEAARAIVPSLPAASEADFDTEWLDSILSIAVVDGVEEALEHIAHHGSAHTEAIIAEDPETAAVFLNGTDSAVVLWNASTQFCDGGEFGFGAEIGIATGRMHARGPVGLEQLTCYRYEVRGNGQVRG
ncbi:gamma-glutamyl phosphate reductase [Gluconobacter thailandicus F149-1 = NBRC 100600]|uniref:Gamma-glutamyl phosphate reductase n=1 Tax=Gluconobacter thailandicus NBRC 3257 TaxID=1381097 RepID=A0ABQ0IWF7_GLUTH|nr:glutamate-5-semialdehyde dehydrogenase [Gluconobacter thailandicus]KXV54447.1 gamma-glutamyl phosphate reductase [Gluconobacter thailandicus]GAC89101.1 gamma-glutamyl phosphate reductase [Gluconobacter thailandicus NBRC 3255]GAD26533.1 gamma-glutamyl phosphate reductase [Gluconobacter thailandicus NBRC 3257]GAN92472.1 gamma-glutamyl phosphate reductase [Gluconobacter thailandicus F149-1 = NBRC 100600]GBR60173.1 gamma-glutamyl phosphate reductase [Gluconobacter thailandicus F149-1 = NBRC 100